MPRCTAIGSTFESPYSHFCSTPAASNDRDLGALPRGVDAASLNLVVVTLDTTRADRIGCYGAKDVATPHLDALAAGGVRFDAAVSADAPHPPAHCTLFTGLLPGAHGVGTTAGSSWRRSTLRSPRS